MEQEFIQHLFNTEVITDADILRVFQYQYNNNIVYQDWCKALGRSPENILTVDAIPFLPIRFFKSHKVVCGNFVPELIFESSGTTQTINSQHLVKSAAIYQQSFTKGFEIFYGNPALYCIIGLLPNYIEKGNSSLIKMADDLIQLSNHADSGFYLYDFEKLHTVLDRLNAEKTPTILLGVTFALLDFADAYPMQLSDHIIVMETGGMKGRKRELTREEVHGVLEKNLGLKNIHSEYGMTELLSQAYSQGNGRYNCPPWIRVVLREENDPLTLTHEGMGLINVIDLANVYSCSFIATDDVGILHSDHSFEVRGRLDNSDIRGCSLLAI